MDIKNIVFENYKCFKHAEISNLQPINIIIGKNNIGKSSILDILEMIYYKRPTYQTTIIADKELSEMDIRRTFKEDTYGGGIPGNNHYEFGKKFIGKNFKIKIKNDSRNASNESYDFFDDIYSEQHKTYWRRLGTEIYYERKIPKRILAERNIFPEIENEKMDVDSNGNGITTIISNYLNKNEYDEDLVRHTLLNKLNEIMGDDANFTEIVTQQIKNNGTTKWEIFLREEDKGRIALSESGSGLKTILMVLVYTILIPDVERKKNIRLYFYV